MKKGIEATRERSAKPSRDERGSAFPGNGSGGNGNSPAAPTPVESPNRIPPDPEVQEKPERRRFSASYKARIVRVAEACTEKGQIAALLRREGLYSSHLGEWRKKYQQGALTALQDDS